MIIYKTINLQNNKIYVGKDSNNNPNYLGSGVLIKRAVRKYGKENFKKEILEHCTSDQLNEREIYWIDRLNSTDQAIGYNLAKGGDTFCNLSEEKKRLKRLKLSEAAKGKIISEEHRRKISNAHKGKKKNYPNGCLGKKGFLNKRFGKTYEEIYGSKATEILFKKSIAARGKVRSQQLIDKFKKEIKQLDQNNNLIKVWPSAKDAGLALKINTKSIYNVIGGWSKSAGGYKWSN